MLTQQRLFEVIHYEPLTGGMHWIKTVSNRAPAGSEIKGTTFRGYKRVRIDGKLYLAHRIAYFYVTGVWPEQIDHKDNDPSNITFDNLRPATGFDNQKNMKLSRRNKSGTKGVFWDKSRQCWAAKLMSNRVSVLNKRFDTREEAEIAVIAARKAHHGEFANNG